MNNPHDRLIRETFQDKKEAATFFKNTLRRKWSSYSTWKTWN
ncbi:transposase, YhgA-like domain protein [Leptospira borgpetersenii serovar Pomona str. 200901868]|uniref:Transposase, YhgA-like domain protein n=1 Tax=Leptospira borgpetersenii serovar Pomona str. 200901868 TaxID=1192866 RepID=M6W1S2_LEPBO|nr:transposase, YhgA-like domain protein [Leptospira borgpetersenii serovar Pomona str. 200901868]